MKRLTFNEGGTTRQKGFFRRQFQKEATGTQKRFDWIFGVALPVIWFSLDPLVFNANHIVGKPLLPDIKTFAFVLSFVSVMAMMAWLLWGARLKGLNAFLAGLFLAGGVIALLGGVGLMPFSVASLFIIGLTPLCTMGLTALLAAFVYLRNFYRAGAAAKLFVEGGFLFNSIALSALLSVVVPMVVNIQVNRHLGKVARSDAQTIRAETQSLKYIAPLTNFDNFRRQYKSANLGSEEKKALAEAYQELTGESLEESMRLLNRDL